jgi:hypothetical protein
MAAPRTNNTPLYKRKGLTAPTMKDAAVDRLRALESGYARLAAAAVTASRCCGRCRTPYNCGNKACSCHGADEVRARLALAN